MNKKPLKNKLKVQKPFNQSFSSESLLQQAIAGLLTRMPDITGVQILQGTQELGKDLVFYIRGGFGEQLLCACVVKNTKITGDAGRAEGARTVFLQAQQAFDTPYVDGSGRDNRVERVYIITPFDLPPATIYSIEGRLKERSGQVVFIGGSTLFDLFKKHWPDYFADEAEFIEQHLKQTLKGFEDNNPLLGIAQDYNVGNIKINAKKVYVPQVFFREIHAYSVGEVFKRSLPLIDVFKSVLTQFEIDKINTNLSRLEQALSYLEDWKLYYPSSKSRPDSDVRKALKEFSSLLKTEWDVVLVTKSRNLERLAATTRAKLENPIRLEKPFKELQGQVQKSLVGFYEALAIHQKVVYSFKSNGVQLLSDSTFLSACNLDHCAHAAPEGLFEPRISCRIEFPKNVLDEWDGPLLIVGAPGHGKTSFCRWHALQDAENFNAGKSAVIPVYVPLHRLSGEDIRTFDKAFLGNLGQSALLGNVKSGSQGTSKGNIRLYLDGLDEVSSTSRRQQIVRLAKKSTQGKSMYQVVLTSRNHIYAPYLNWLPRISLGGFEDADVKALIAQWLGKKTEDSRKFYEQLRGIPTLNGLMRTPLLATLIILVFRQTGKLPENRTRLYEVFIELLSGGWDIAKRVLRKSKFGQHVKIPVLKSLAATLHERRRREFGNNEIKSAIRATFSKAMLNDWELMRDEFIEDGLISRGGNILQFSHLSFQEFLVAKNYIGHPLPTRINTAVISLLRGDDWWKEPVSFYIGLSGNPREIMSWLDSHIRNFRGGNVSNTIISDLLIAARESFPEYQREN
jgi:hypothetical protein